MDKLILHSATRDQIDRFLATHSHALLLLAPEGSGKRSVAEIIAGELLGLENSQNWHEEPGIIYIEPVNKVISIEAIRGLQKQLQLKTIGQRPVRRVVIIEAAHRITTEGQNALLKMLEEPAADTVFILTAISTDSVLPTIYSRTQHIDLKQPPQADITDLFKRQGIALSKIEAAQRYSGQRIGLMHALLNQEDHPLLEASNQARKVLTAPLLERLELVDEWTKNKEELPERLESLQRLCQAGLSQAAQKNDVKLMKRWQRYYQAAYDAGASLSRNPNAKLLLTNLFLSLS